MRRRALPLARAGRRLAELAVGLPAGTIDFAVTRDLRAPMRDGAVLLGDLYRPRGSGPTPVVLIRTPYGRRSTGSRVLAIVLARRGFQVFVQSVRGTFGSGGAFRPYTDEHHDGLHTLAWVRAQRWCDGRVATTGGSYFGHTQWAIAPYADPPLVSASLHVTGARISSLLYEHGAPGTLNALTWSDQLERQELPRRQRVLGGRGRRRRVVRALRTRPLRTADLAVTGGRPSTFWRDFTAHAEPDDPFWAVADHDGADLTRMPPVNMVTGWWDLFLQLQLHDYTRLRAAGVPARLTVGPWLHGSGPELRELLRSDLEWLEHHLHGGPAPEGAPVHVWLQGADRWLDLETWPPAVGADERYLTGRGGLDPAPPAGIEGPSTFTFDPADPTPVAGGPLLSAPAMQVDDRETEAGADVLVFTGPAEAAHLDLVGSVVARVHVRPALAHADVFVRLCDVAPDGVSRTIVDGIRRLDPRTVPASDVAVGDDGILAVDVELFPTAYRLPAGHRLRVVFAGGAFPRFAPNPGTAGVLGELSAGAPCRFEVFHDAARPSRITLPVLR